MSIDREDVKRGIDAAAEKLKEATDMVADAAKHANAKAHAKAQDFAQKAGDTLIEHGEKLKKTADTNEV